MAGANVLITGGTGAIGRAVARRMAGAGATILLHGTDPHRTDGIAARLTATGAGAAIHPFAADFREGDAIETLVARVIASTGRLDAVVHCAGLGVARIAGPFAATDPQALALLPSAMLGGLQRLCHAALPHLAAHGGAIVTLAADSGRFAAPRQAPLAAAHGGIMSFVRSLAMEVAVQGIRVHCISTSFVEDTPIFDASVATGNGRAEKARSRAGLGLPRPDDIAALALFLCSPDAARLTGQVISVNGGLNA